MTQLKEGGGTAEGACITRLPRGDNLERLGRRYGKIRGKFKDLSDC
jgi:hypothetical protein